MTSFSANKGAPGRSHQVVMMLFPGVSLLDVAGPLQVFEDAAQVTQSARRTYEITAVSLQGGAISTDVGIGLQTVPVEQLQGPIDTLLVPGGAGVWPALADPEFLSCFGDLAGRAQRIGSVCIGAFILAALGLLSGRRATTHWRYCDQFSKQYPDVIVEADPIFVKDPPIWTSAGASAGIDLALAMVEEDLNRHTALAVAQGMVVFLKRPGGQSQFSYALAAQASDRDGEFAQLQAWMVANVSSDLRVETLAARAGMTPRTFARQFVAQTGVTPAKAAEKVRVEAARVLLATAPEISNAKIAHRSGFGDEETMRRAFLRVLGVAPHEYRERFGDVSG